MLRRLVAQPRRVVPETVVVPLRVPVPEARDKVGAAPAIAHEQRVGELEADAEAPTSLSRPGGRRAMRVARGWGSGALNERVVVVGADGIPAVAPLSVATMNDALRFDRLSMEQIGDDILEVLAIRARPA